MALGVIPQKDLGVILVDVIPLPRKNYDEFWTMLTQLWALLIFSTSISEKLLIRLWS